MIYEPLVDQFGRVHTNLRISVTDRCNIRCFYCMPNENIRLRPRSEILTFEEITRFVGIAARLGVNKLRITGGEPLVRAELPQLMQMLGETPGIEDLALTTNGVLLAQHAEKLKSSGLRRLNISLDTLREATFQQIARREGLDQVLEGIAAAKRAGFEKIRLNAIAIRDLTESEVVPLARFAREHALELRFIEFMPLDAEQHWDESQVLSGDEIRAMLEAEYGPLIAVGRDDPAQPATNFRYSDNIGRVGFINPVTQPFCHDCNRLRITAEGKLRNCLFSTAEWDARELLRSDATDQEIAELLRECILAKQPGHGIDDPQFVRPERAMYQIGG